MTNLLQPAPGSTAGPELRRGRPGLPLLQVGVATGLPLLTQLSGGVPKGYLRVLVFDRDSALVSQQTEQLQGTALNNYDSLRIRVVLPQDGYVSAYVGNESDVDVYFDDIKVVHGQGLQVQESAYDPTGLELAGLSGTTPGLKRLSQYKWNGKEFQTDLGLNWTQLDWRMFDPQLDHLPVVDPLVENGQENMSPYAFGYDNAVRYSDPDGLQGVQGTPGIASDPLWYVQKAGLSIVQSWGGLIDRFSVVIDYTTTRIANEVSGMIGQKDAGIGYKATTTDEIRNETKFQPTVKNALTFTGNNEVQGPLYSVKSTVKVSRTEKVEVSGTFRKVPVKASYAAKTDQATKSISNTLEVSSSVPVPAMGKGKVSNGNASIGVSYTSDDTGAKTVKAGAKVETQLSPKVKTSTGFTLGFSL